MAAARAERALERYAEPLAAIHGGAWPARLLELAWRKVVDNSAHDSICGCSRDVVVDQVLIRFAEAEQIGRGIAAAAIRPLAAAAPRGSAVVVNPSPFERTDVVEVDLPVPAAWETVELALPDGGRLPTQLVERPETVLRRLRLTRTPGAGAVRASPPRAGAVRAFARRPPRPARDGRPRARPPHGRPGRPGRLRRRHRPRCRRRGGGRRSRRGVGRHGHARRSTAAAGRRAAARPRGDDGPPGRGIAGARDRGRPRRRRRPLAQERVDRRGGRGRRHAHDRGRRRPPRRRRPDRRRRRLR